MALFDLPLDQLETYRPQLREPADLDAFWQSTLDEARVGPALVDAVPVGTGLRLVDTWDVTFAGHGGHPVKAWFSRPAGSSSTPLPAVVEYVGYGRGRGLPHERITWSAAGYAHLVMDTRGQGSQHGSGGGTADPVGSGPAAPGFVTRGIDDPSGYYFTRLVTDAVRAVDAVRGLPGVDPSRVVAAGNSQGGGLALAVAGLVPDLAALLTSVPFMCHVERALAITDQQPYGEVVSYLAVHREKVDQVLRTLSYVDGASLGRRATAPAHFGVALRDTVCPPSTVFAAYNHYGRGPSATHDVPDGRAPLSAESEDLDTEICVYPFNHHEGGDALHVRRQLDWLAERVPV